MTLNRTVAQWHGKEDLRTALLAAIDHNCVCEFNEEKVRLSECESHKILVEGQRELDGFGFAREIRARLFAEEGMGMVSFEEITSPEGSLIHMMLDYSPDLEVQRSR